MRGRGHRHHEEDDEDDDDDMCGRQPEPNQLFTKMMAAILKVEVHNPSCIIFSKTDSAGRTPFHYATMRGNVQMLELMKKHLDQQLQPEQARRILAEKDRQGKTAKDVAPKKKKKRKHKGKEAVGPEQTEQATGAALAKSEAGNFSSTSGGPTEP